MECTFIAIGIVSYLAVVSLHHKTGGLLRLTSR